MSPAVSVARRGTSEARSPRIANVVDLARLDCRNMNSQQEGLAAEVRAEMARRRLTATAIQRDIGVSSTAWSTYFVQCTRDVPLSVVVGVAEHLGLSASELLRRAEVAATQGGDWVPTRDGSAHAS